MLVAYVSGHGFGHATRTAEVLRQVRALEPGLPIRVATAAPAWLFHGVIDPPLEVRALECDAGLAQQGALVVDEAGSAERWLSFARGFAALVDRESRWLAAAGARVVLGDVPPLAFAAASEAGLPSVAVCNFSWDWIYRHLAPRQAALAEAAAASAEAYGRCGLLLSLPFAGDLRAFPVRRSIPLVARRPRLDRSTARERLGLPPGSPVVLLSFGGLGLPGFDPGVLGALGDLLFVQVAEGPGGGRSAPPPNLRLVGRDRLSEGGLGYEDVVAAADVVVTKPGYGIVSDAIGARTRLVYTERGDFPEYPILVEGMPAYLPCAHVSNADLLAGRLQAALDRVLGIPFPEAAPDAGGARVAAESLLGLA